MIRKCKADKNIWMVFGNYGTTFWRAFRQIWAKSKN